MIETSRFSYKPNIPVSLRPEIEKLFQPFEWLVPAWCERVNIHWDSKGADEDCAQTTTHFAYRWASISLFPMFWDQSEEKKRQSVVHELLHISTAPVADYARNAFESLVKADAPKFHEHLQSELGDRYEGMVQDLMRIILSKTERAKRR
jgi:hypothetical protein